MSKQNPYKILGINELTCTYDDIEYAYHTLKRDYVRNIKLDGYDKKLDELEKAYSECLSIYRAKNVEVNSSFQEIESLIMQNKSSDAQRLLDNNPNRNAEWHYLQAQIYASKRWFSEAESQIELALAMDMENEKYKTTRSKIKAVLYPQGGNQDANHRSQNRTRANYTEPKDRKKGLFSNNKSDDSCCLLCGSFLCADSCCECMGGDCIPC